MPHLLPGGQNQGTLTNIMKTIKSGSERPIMIVLYGFGRLLLDVDLVFSSFGLRWRELLSPMCL